MTSEQIEALRVRTYLYLTPEVAGCAGLRVEDLQRFISHSFQPTEPQLNALWRRLQMDYAQPKRFTL
jgi:hypothetical protein